MSITNLLKQNGMQSLPNGENAQPSKSDSVKLHNPYIPRDMAGTDKEVKSTAYDKVKGQKNYLIYQNQRFDKLKGKPINGDWLSMPYNTNYGGKSYNQQLSGAIDPENKMRKLNPLRARAYDYIQGAEGFDFRTLPESVYKSHNSVDLVSKAAQSYSSRLVSYGQMPALQINNVPIKTLEAVNTLLHPPPYSASKETDKYQTNINPSYISVEKLL
jgi:hypothetical protein